MAANCSIKEVEVCEQLGHPPLFSSALGFVNHVLLQILHRQCILTFAPLYSLRKTIELLFLTIFTAQNVVQ